MLKIRTLIILLLLFKYLIINAQTSVVKFIKPAIVGPLVSGIQAGGFALESVNYDLQTRQGKLIAGGLKLQIAEDSKIPEIWNAFLSSEPIDIEIYQFSGGQNPKLLLTLKLENSFVNAIKFETTTDNKVALHNIDIWMNEFAFEYLFYDVNGSLKSKHSSGWNFVTNSTNKF